MASGCQVMRLHRLRACMGQEHGSDAGKYEIHIGRGLRHIRFRLVHGVRSYLQDTMKWCHMDACSNPACMPTHRIRNRIHNGKVYFLLVRIPISAWQNSMDQSLCKKISEAR